MQRKMWKRRKVKKKRERKQAHTHTFESKQNSINVNKPYNVMSVNTI